MTSMVQPAQVERVGSITVTTPAGIFVAAERFQELKLSMSFLNQVRGNFQDRFLAKVEENKVAVTEKLIINRLLKMTLADFAIITALDGYAKVEITLAQFFAVFEKQANGEDGPLQTDGKGNAAYIRDTYGVLWSVNGYWDWCSDNGGWIFNAIPPDYDWEWGIGTQFLSH